jgi:hypothetical protein
VVIADRLLICAHRRCADEEEGKGKRETGRKEQAV